ncbi:hypothetical protein H5410_045648 [Solanum commersonii]|uniref:Uncharacterized protein n=1 Tax=Solanum commersonii TaxID=4109 RepID=A0A9J5XDC0_SOLCO|nr:hypothetical protein H5410_045648 [Solanum commersonii]
MNDHRDHILGWMNEVWNKWRGHLHAKYVKDKPIQHSLRIIPRGVDEKINGNGPAFWFGATPGLASFTFSLQGWTRASLGCRVVRNFGYQSYQSYSPDQYPTGRPGKFVSFQTKCILARSSRNVVNRAKLKMLHHIGSKPIRGINYHKMANHQIWRLLSLNEENKFLNKENKSFNEENKSLNDLLSTLEDEMKEIMKMKELFAAQQPHVQPATSPVST